MSTMTYETQSKALIEILEKFIRREYDETKNDDIKRANWYNIATVALAASSAGEYTPIIYKRATTGLSLADKKIVQSRILEAALKCTVLYGVPKCLQALMPLFKIIPDDEIANISPRFDSLSRPDATSVREKRGQDWFDTLWTPQAARANAEQWKKHSKDLWLLNQKHIYDWYISEASILNGPETHMCTAAALICSNSPIQVVWHTKGLIRHGGNISQAKYAHDFAFAVAKLFDVKTGNVPAVDQIDFEDERPH